MNVLLPFPLHLDVILFHESIHLNQQKYSSLPATYHSTILFVFQKRYVAPTNQESLKLQSIIGYNGNGRDNLIWHPSTGFFAYTVTCNIIVENLNTSQQMILSGKSNKILDHQKSEFDRFEKNIRKKSRRWHYRMMEQSQPVLNVRQR